MEEDLANSTNYVTQKELHYIIGNQDHAIHNTKVCLNQIEAQSGQIKDINQTLQSILQL